MERLTGKSIKGFFAVEGIDGSGKTTLLRELRDYCNRVKRDDVFFCCEPTNEPIGIIARNNSAPGNGLLPSTAAYLFAADRYEHLYNGYYGVMHMLNEGYKVVMDRYIYSSIVYQAYEGMRTREESEMRGLALALNRDFEKPEKIFYLDCPPHVARDRQVMRQKENPCATHGHIDTIEKLSELCRLYDTLWREMEIGLVETGANFNPKVVILDARKDVKELMYIVGDYVLNGISG